MISAKVYTSTQKKNARQKCEMFLYFCKVITPKQGFLGAKIQSQELNWDAGPIGGNIQVPRRVPCPWGEVLQQKPAVKLLGQC